MTSISNIVARHTGQSISTGDIKALRKSRIHPLLAHDENLLATADAYKTPIDTFTRQIRAIEKKILDQTELSPAYQNLMSIPGVGRILGLTILLETGPVERFPSVGDYVSYCRKVPTARISNDKIKGRGNPKNGNRYLAWAYGEAAEHARRHDDKARAYYNRKNRKSGTAIAHSALAHKLARAAYHMMRSGERFMPERVFG